MQLRRSLQCDHGEKVERIDRILPCFDEQDALELSQTPCILGRCGTFIEASKAFYPATLLRKYPLAPHIDQVDENFAIRHPKLLQLLQVRHNPNISDLEKVQKALQFSKEGRIEENDLSVALATLEIATLVDLNTAAQLLIPDTTLIMRTASNIVHGDREISGKLADLHFTHPTVSEDLIHRLGLETAHQRAISLAIEIDGEEDDEYVPEEKLSSIISE